MTEIRVPSLGESVTEATVAKWFKAVGDSVAADEPLVELETDKVTVEVPAATAGTISEITAKAGVTVAVGALLGQITDGQGVAMPCPTTPAPTAKAATPKAEAPAAPAPSVAIASAPSARRVAAEKNLDLAQVPGSGRDGRVLKGDVLAQLERGPAPVAKPAVPSGPRARADREERVRMTRLRQRIAQRLKEAQNTAAMLTTFNEVDMSAVMALRSLHKDAFEAKHGVKLGFMSFFVAAAVTVLREIPAVNGEIDGDDLVYKNYYDIGVAVSAPQGLVVPVLRDADQRSFADLEKAIADFGQRARDGKLKIEELSGGTFTISNGGVFGSLLSTPILNPPQSAILGMHAIQKRPVAVGDQVQIRPMMYVALSYDHRIIDGREAVTFLVRLKQCIEDPNRLLLDM
ncbi:MAG: 2-oxoglutarate dehydrogenase complex dihydrolipoyllysine-residue succinyltransferase [Alphaproteobacteria bacterium]|nr:2-oxoglutarate dehydrogenase complex dihydrolipoyllysine-residue succinyltransferase [Alphaproteobacteria bacterium]